MTCATARAALVEIQRHPWHAKIGEFVRYEYATAKGVEKRFTVRLTTRDVCPWCDVRRECQRASIALAVEETRVIGGADA